MSGLLDAVDIGVLSSRSEMFARAVAEPMGFGIPVAGTDVPGIREVMGDAGRAVARAAWGRPCAGGRDHSGLLSTRTSATRVGRANAELIRARQSREATSHVYAGLLVTELARRGRM